MINTRSLLIATVIGTVLQVVMVVVGHYNTSVASLFAVGGTGISFIAGLLYAWSAKDARSPALGAVLGGVVAGGVCAFIGIIVSYLYGDVPASVLGFGTVSSMVTGAFGAWLGRSVWKARAAAVVALAVVTGAHVAQAQASNTRPSRAAAVKVADFAWLAGSWEAKDIEHGTLHVVFTQPEAGLITGVMHLVSPDNKILVVELITLLDTPRGVVLRYRHFSSELEAYESTYKQSMLLTSHRPDRDVFENEVLYTKGLMSTEPRTTTFTRRPDGTFVGRSEIIGEDGKPAVIEGTYQRVSN